MISTERRRHAFEGIWQLGSHVSGNAQNEATADPDRLAQLQPVSTSDKTRVSLGPDAHREMTADPRVGASTNQIVERNEPATTGVA